MPKPTELAQSEEILRALEDAARRKLWGQIQIDFQRGTPVLIRVSETRKLQSDSKENYHEYSLPRSSE